MADDVGMSKEAAAKFLDRLAALFDEHPDVRLFYTINDDGVHVEFEGSTALKNVDVNLGFSGDTIVQSARDYAAWLRQ